MRSANQMNNSLSIFANRYIFPIEPSHHSTTVFYRLGNSGNAVGLRRLGHRLTDDVAQPKNQANPEGIPSA